MQLQKATRLQTKIKMALQGPSGSGKTYSALLIAFGITGDWNKIAVIDSENQSSNLYADLGSFSVLSVVAPYSPEKFASAISFCENASIQVIIIDSLSHEWEGSGGILDMHSKMAGNSFTNWAKLTPRHNALVEAILQSPAHIIVTLRTKQDYVLTDKGGKMVPEKVGLRAIQRDGTDYEFTLVFDIDINHQAIASKDRTGVFVGRPQQILSVSTGQEIINWCQQGLEASTRALDQDAMTGRINDCRSVEELLDLFTQNPNEQQTHIADFTRRRRELQQTQIIQQPSKAQNNGHNQ